MIVFVLLIVGIVAYIHYVQGLFSATISAICAVIAAVVAISYHEMIAQLTKGAMANYMQGIALCALFGLTYFILRTIADKVVPGNVRYPLMVDKIGAGVMGLVAGLFAAGVVALAGQSLPFGPSIGGYARYTVDDRAVTISVRGRDQDSSTFSEMKETSFEPAKVNGMFIPVDDMVVGIVSKLSEGALSNDKPLASIHPDWMTELFGQRAGVEVGSKRVLLNLPGLQMVDLKGLYKLDSVPEVDGEIIRMRQTPLVPEKGGTLKPNPDETLLITRINFDANATDGDSKARLSCASVRLLAWRDKGGAREYLNYTPIGTLEEAFVLLRNKPDDPFVVAGGKSVDFVFKVAGDDVFKEFKPKAKELDIKSDVFVEVKRMAQIDLSGKKVEGPPVFSKDVEIVRKPLDQLGKVKRPAAAPESGAAAPQQNASAGPFEITALKLNDKLIVPVNPGTYDAGAPEVTFPSGSATMHDKKFEKLKVTPEKSFDELKAGDFPVTALFVPDGKKMVQLSGKPIQGKDAWGWTNLSQFELVDSGGNKVKPNGAFAKVKQTGADRLLVQYEAQNEVGSIEKADGRPYEIYIVFNVPSGTQIKELQHEGKPIYEKPLKVP